MVASPGTRAREDDISLLDHTQRIPNELLTHVVDYLPASQLLLVSSVSKRFRAAITRDNRFCITIHIEVTNDNILNNICYQQVARAEAIIDHAIPKQLAVAMTVDYQHDYWYPRGVPATLRNYMCDAVLPIVRAALPILVRLAVEIPNDYSAALQAILHQPAPLLRDLTLSRVDVLNELDYDLDYDYDREPEREPEDFAHVVPCSVFSESAPRLLRVSLCNLSLAEGPIPAFVSVRCVALRYDSHTPDIHIARIFPCATELQVDVEEGLTPPTTINYSGLSLQHLHIGDRSGCRLLDTMIGRLDFARIPTVTYTSLEGCTDDHKTLIDSTSGDLSMRMRELGEPDLDSEVEFRASSGGLRRVFLFERFSWDTYRDFNIFDFRIVDIRMEYVFLIVLLEFECDLPVLRRLRIDFAKPRIDFSKPSDITEFDHRFWFPRWRDAPDDDSSTDVSDDDDSTDASESSERDSSRLFPISTHAADDDNSVDASDNNSFTHASDAVERDSPIFSDIPLMCCPLLDVLAFTAPDFATSIHPRHVAFIGHTFGQLERSPEARARLEMFGVTFVEHARRQLLDLVFPDIVYHSRDEVLDWGENEEWPRTRQ